ncbi:MAG: prolyl oligopeptidase family serine peptidase [Candidatus Latescibacteria bacterium]|nr:prolyl oligopeptidase family serine peptidase [Candidatus Latescibacterota bacterium]
MSLQPADIHQLRQLSSPALAPDAQALVYVEAFTCSTTMKTQSRLLLVQTSTGQSRPLTAGPSDSSPQYAPDGLHIAFLRPGPDKNQIWLLPAGPGEAVQLTHLSGGVRQFAWAPDSHRLVVVSRLAPDAPEGESDYPQTQVVRRIRYRDDGDGWRGDAFSQLFIVAIDGAAPVQLTSGEGDHTAPAWSPDGARIAYISDQLENRDISRHSQVQVIPAQGGQPETWSTGLCRIGSVAWAPDSRRLAAAGSHDAQIWDPRQSWLYTLEADRPYRILAGATHSIVQPLPEKCWSPQDQLIYVADKAGQSHLFSVAANGGQPQPIAGGDRTFTAPVVAGQRAAVVAAAADTPGDLLSIDLNASTDRWLTRANSPFLDTHPAAAVEKISFDRAGCTIEARLLFPPDFESSNKYPLVLDIHGGPNGRFSDSYDIAQQMLIGAGYLVLAVNPRGSSSYGPEFLKAVLRDWGGEDFLDLMAAVDLVCQRPYIDADRLGVHGYSYGGYMSSWIIGHDHRFKAAVIGAPCINLHSMYGTSDIGVSFGENQWGGSSLESTDALIQRSPLTYAAQVTTPALLMHGETDYRCPIEQSEQFFVALKRQGKTVELVRFPDSSHNFRSAAHPALREEYYHRMVAWFERFFTF